MRNPLPVDRFNPADAARRTWPQLIESMMEAVCLVEPEGLRIVAANVAAGALLDIAPSELIGQAMLELSATPEDEAFWQEVAEGISDGIVSETYVVRRGSEAIPVTRRVTRVEPGPGATLYVVALLDRAGQVAAERKAEASRAELEATLESVSDGVLVVDLAGHISNFNRRFAAMWRVPAEMLQLRADDEIFEWLRQQVADPRQYTARLEALEADPLSEATDRIQLRPGGSFERVSVPQCSRGRPIGRVFTFRDMR